MAWVRFPDGSRRKVERIEKADAERDLNDLLALRVEAGTAGPRRERLASFDDVIDNWFAAGCPKAAVSAPAVGCARSRRTRSQRSATCWASTCAPRSVRCGSYNPDLDPTNRDAQRIVAYFADVLRHLGRVDMAP